MALENDRTKYWQNTCIWLVASKRIAKQAKQLGLANVIESDGANEKAISTSLQALIEKKR